MITTKELVQKGLFADLSEEQLTDFIILADEISVPKNKILFDEGDKATKLYILLEGKIRVGVRLSSRPAIITTTILNQFGQLVGWSGFMQPNHYTATAICQEDSRLLVVNGEAFMRALEQDPAMGFLVMRRMAEVISDRLRNIQRVVFKTL